MAMRVEAFVLDSIIGLLCIYQNVKNLEYQSLMSKYIMQKILRAYYLPFIKYFKKSIVYL